MLYKSSYNFISIFLKVYIIYLCSVYLYKCIELDIIMYLYIEYKYILGTYVFIYVYGHRYI